jgi:AcrR family transcriptional regulator
MPPRSRPAAPHAAAPIPGRGAGSGARERIARAATVEFSRHGFDGARIDAIARSAGVNKALLYYYFPNKAELYRQLVLEHITAAATALEEAARASDDPAAALRGIVAALFALLSARPEVSGFMLREVLNGWGHLRDEDFPVLFRTTRPIAGVVERGAATGAFRPVPPIFVHLLVIATLNFFIVSRDARARGARALGQSGIDPDPAEFARFVADFVTKGLAPTPPGASVPVPEGDPS